MMGRGEWNAEGFYASMHKSNMLFWVVAVAGAMSACGGSTDEPNQGEELASVGSELTAQQRLAACAQDPRVQAGLVTQNVCAGASIFFNETFGGNGRTCGSCHPVGNNYTIDPTFVAAQHGNRPEDPLFVFEQQPALANLETSDLLDDAAILENLDGFEDPTHKFVSRSVPHIMSLATSRTRDSQDGTSASFTERLGWSGDGSSNGSLRAFLEGAIKQHFTKRLARVAGTDFRLPSAQESDLAAEYQLSVGRLNELDLSVVRLFDAAAETGRQAFRDPARGRCNSCHFNAGANFDLTRRNRNFDTGIVRANSSLTIGFVGNVGISDGGFGGQGLASPNVDVNGIGFPNGFGNLTFNTPPLIEAADTGPFFHSNRIGDARVGPTIEDAVAHYASVPFLSSIGAAQSQARFGSPLDLNAGDGLAIARFLRVLNTALNLDMATQRLAACRTLALRFGNTRVDIQRRLIELSFTELDDALQDMTPVDLYPAAQEQVTLAKFALGLAIATTSSSQRRQYAGDAMNQIATARGLLGSNINFQLGQGNLMF
jgi:hypothetical protein